MMVLWEKKFINVKELGKYLYLDSGTLTPVLKKLEQKGYIKKESQKGRTLKLLKGSSGKSVTDSLPGIAGSSVLQDPAPVDHVDHFF